MAFDKRKQLLMLTERETIKYFKRKQYTRISVIPFNLIYFLSFLSYE